MALKIRFVDELAAFIVQTPYLNAESIRLDGGTPEETEGGRQSAIITIRYEYYVNYDIQTSLI